MRCAIGECAEVATAKGWCGRHYGRWVRHGDPLAPVRSRATAREPVKERLDYTASRYGLTADTLADLYAAQGGRCAICRELMSTEGPDVFHVDHCHDTGRARGLLCRGCNTGIGLLGDDPDRLEVAAAYLRAGRAC